jgi:hypothetical protein
MLFENEPINRSAIFDASFVSYGRLRVLLGANGQPGSMAIGNILMVLAKIQIAQGEKPVDFHMSITKVARCRKIQQYKFNRLQISRGEV